MDGNQVPQELVTKVGEVFESILKEARDFVFNYLILAFCILDSNTVNVDIH